MALSFVFALVAVLLTTNLFAQARGYVGSMSMSPVISPTVMASWMSHDNYGDGSQTALLNQMLASLCVRMRPQ